MTVKSRYTKESNSTIDAERAKVLAVIARIVRRGVYPPINANERESSGQSCNPVEDPDSF